MPLAEYRDLVGGRLGHRLDHCDVHGAAAQSLQFLDLRFYDLEIPAGALDMRKQQLAGTGQPHSARQALEQGTPTLNSRSSICLLTADAAIFSTSAAPRIDPCLATDAK